MEHRGTSKGLPLPCNWPEDVQQAFFSILVSSSSLLKLSPAKLVVPHTSCAFWRLFVILPLECKLREIRNVVYLVHFLYLRPFIKTTVFVKILLTCSTVYGEGNGSPLQYSCLKSPWTQEPGGLQSMGSRRVEHDWATSLPLFIVMHWRRKWQPTTVFLPEESYGWQSLVGCRLWGRTESDPTEATQQENCIDLR